MLEYDWLTLDRVTGTAATGMLEQQLLSTLTNRCRAGSHLTSGCRRALRTQAWPGSRSGPSEGLKQRGRACADMGRSLGMDPASVNALQALFKTTETNGVSEVAQQVQL